MKATFFTYPSAFQNIGGGEIQLTKTREYLQKQGVTVDLFDPWRSRVEDYDVLHVFGSVKDCLALVRVANARGVKVALSTIFWSDFRRALFTSGSLMTKFDFTARHLAKLLLPALPSARRRLMQAADVLLPNSEMEKRQLCRLFAISPKKVRVVPNGVDASFLNSNASVWRARYGAEPFILGVGRVEPRKNQLNLIRAVKRLKGQRLVLIGSPVSGYEDYFARCQKEGAGFTTFLPTLKHEDPLLGCAYAACSVFVLQGWFETPGLAALEAALTGARLVVTNGGSTREYFKDLALYIDPSAPADIAAKISASLAVPATDNLKRHVLDHFTWEKAAEATARSYKEILHAE